MSFHDPIADFLTRIRNAVKAKAPTVSVSHSKIKEAMLVILKQEGYIKDFSIAGEVKKELVVNLKYTSKHQSPIHNLRQISKPSLRIYAEASKLPSVLNGLGIAIVSTTKGIITSKQAREANLGGEVIAYVW